MRRIMHLWNRFMDWAVTGPYYRVYIAVIVIVSVALGSVWFVALFVPDDAITLYSSFRFYEHRSDETALGDRLIFDDGWIPFLWDDSEFICRNNNGEIRFCKPKVIKDAN